MNVSQDITGILPTYRLITEPVAKCQHVGRHINGQNRTT